MAGFVPCTSLMLALVIIRGGHGERSPRFPGRRAAPKRQSFRQRQPSLGPSPAPGEMSERRQLGKPVRPVEGIDEDGE